MWRIFVILFLCYHHVPEVKMQSTSVYNGCGQTKTCFGVPDSCVESQDCQGLATVELVDDRFVFELFSINVRYVGMGISRDAIMGDDAGMECVEENGVVRAYASYIIARPILAATRDDIPQTVIQVEDYSFVNGNIYCRMERQAVTTVREHHFDLVNEQYHLLVAIGNEIRENSVGSHTQRIASSEPFYFGSIVDLRGTSVVLYRLHGAFMLVAWIGAASAGMLLARYFKQTWVNSSLCGKDQWFAWHRVLMIITWALTMAGFIIIFVELGGWSAEDNPHAILGTISTILCFFQPFMALLRPGPTHNYRPIFNAFHWLVGNGAHVLAIVAIFYAVPLGAAQLPDWYEWLLVAFVVFHIIMHFILTIAASMSEQKKARREPVKTLPITNGQPQDTFREITDFKEPTEQRKIDAPYSKVRKALLAIYLIIIASFTVVLVVLAAIAPI